MGVPVPPTTQTMTVSEVRGQLDGLVDRVGHGETRVLVERDGVPVAALVAADDLERLARFEAEEARLEAEDWAVIDRLRERSRDADPDQVLRDATEAVEEVRREMYEEEQRAAARRR